ncbi:MAG: class I SAM-dependent methyltransferase [Syntrophobacteraceae bacterium]
MAESIQGLLPDELVCLWGTVQEGQLSSDRFYQIQDRLLEEYREQWKQALLLDGWSDLPESIVREIGSYLGEQDSGKTRQLCDQALETIRDEWHERVGVIDNDSVELFYDQNQAMLYELMWWHTLTDDLSPLAYVVALKFAEMHGCERYLDFGSGVGSGGILFARSGIAATLADVSSTILNFSQWRFKQRGLVADHIDLKERKLPEDSFDFITAMDVFEHLVDPVATVGELEKALKKGGFLFGRFHAEMDKDRPHHIVLDFEPTLRELKARGFERIWQDKWLWGHEIFQKV